MHRLHPDQISTKLATRLFSDPQGATDAGCALVDEGHDYEFDQPPRAAAVMLALVARENGPHVLYTKRSANLRDHSGQVAFPGGKIDGGDASPYAAAAREAHEEVALSPDDVRFVGYLPTYHTGTNFLVTPVVTQASPRAALVANPNEVDDIFEVPLAHLLVEENYEFITHTFPSGQVRKTWRIAYDDWQIWGITANITRMFFERVLAPLQAEIDGVSR